MVSLLIFSLGLAACAAEPAPEPKEPYVTISAVSVTGENLQMTEAETHTVGTYSATVTAHDDPDNTLATTITWCVTGRTEDDGVIADAEISAGGVLTVRQAGTYTITAAADADLAVTAVKTATVLAYEAPEAEIYSVDISAVLSDDTSMESEHNWTGDVKDGFLIVMRPGDTLAIAVVCEGGAELEGFQAWFWVDILDVELGDMTAEDFGVYCDEFGVKYVPTPAGVDGTFTIELLHVWDVDGDGNPDVDTATFIATIYVVVGNP